MAWKLVLVDSPPDVNPRIVGQCWYDNEPNSPKSARVSKYYKEHNARRGLIWVSLPSGDFCVDWCATDDPEKKGWIVKGELPNITVEPSIDCVGHYHGFIRDGIITDDCEGRTFETTKYTDYDKNKI